MVLCLFVCLFLFLSHDKHLVRPKWDYKTLKISKNIHPLEMLIQRAEKSHRPKKPQNKTTQTQPQK